MGQIIKLRPGTILPNENNHNHNYDDDTSSRDPFGIIGLVLILTAIFATGDSCYILYGAACAAAIYSIIKYRASVASIIAMIIAVVIALIDVSQQILTLLKTLKRM